MTPRFAASLLALNALVLAAHTATAADADGDGLRDGFEARSGVTESDSRHSDADGIIDAAEDHDADRLSNLGEQRFDTHPGRRDTDSDGVTDGAEDADRDGRSNARQQDRRPLPRGLTPSLAAAPTAWPAVRYPCQTAHGKSRIHPCLTGDREGDTVVVLFGDSHATQWQPALAAVAKRDGWRLWMITKTGCPSVDIMPAGQLALDGGRSCRTWRRRAIDWIGARRPDVFVVSNLGSYRVGAASWGAALGRTLRALPRPTQAVVLADTPRQRVLPVSCLTRHRTNIAACVTTRSRALDRAHERVERDAAHAAGASFISLSGKICPYDPCPLVIGTTLLWRDDTHITARFSRELWPSMRRLLASVGEP